MQLLITLVFLIYSGWSSVIAASPPNVTGIHHVKVPVSNINVSLAWYTRVMGAQRLTNLDHIDSTGVLYAVELAMPSFGRTVMELRLNTEQSSAQQMFDPITWAVETLPQLAQWKEWLTSNNVPASPVFTGVTGWVLVFQVGQQVSFKRTIRVTFSIGSRQTVSQALHV